MLLSLHWFLAKLTVLAVGLEAVALLFGFAETMRILSVATRRHNSFQVLLS